MRTIEIKEDLVSWRAALQSSRTECLAVVIGGYRMILHGGKVLSCTGHSDMDVTPVTLEGMDKLRAAEFHKGKACDGTERYKRSVAEAMDEDARNELKPHYTRYIPPESTFHRNRWWS